MHTDRTLIVANWKMNMTVGQASHYVANLHKAIAGHRDIEVVLAPNHLAIQPLSQEIDRRRFRLAAQDAYSKDEGAFTGEVSFAMLRDLVHYVIIGHSERRIYFGETNDSIRDKMAACVRNGITPILCIGETAADRADGQTRQVLHDQLVTALSNLTPEDMSHVVITYEPVWAISTFGNKHCDPHEADKAFRFIRQQVADLYGTKAAADVKLIYGGSVDNQNVASYLSLEDCSGALVGAASLNAHKFTGIVDAAYRINRLRKSES